MSESNNHQLPSYYNNIVVNHHHGPVENDISHDDTTKKLGKESNELNNIQEKYVFGNFSTEEYENYFSYNGVQNAGVEFICETFNATKCWVEEGSKHTFSYLNNIQSDLKPQSVEKSFGVDKDLLQSNQNVNVGNSSEEKSPEEKKPESNTAEEIQKHSSWASLFKNSQTDTCNGTTHILSVQMDNTSKKEKPQQSTISLIDMSIDKRALTIAETINELSPNYNRHHLELRGLINRGNWCYINTTLQALLGISVISHFYKSLKEFSNSRIESTSIPLMDSMILFFDHFEPFNPKIAQRKQDDVRTGNAFEPRWIYNVLPVMKTTLSEKGRQEDAEEFLSFLLNGIHDELVELQKLVKKGGTTTQEGECLIPSDTEPDIIHTSENEEEETWEHVGKKNKGTILRKASIDESLIKHVFGGVVRFSVHQAGKKESTTLQPFFTLQLDIQSENIWTLKEALESYFMKESLDGFTCATTNIEVEASRRTSIEELPLIFIFHLKYFVFDIKGGCQKIHKALDIPVNLEIPKDILSSDVRASVPAYARNYKLCAVVYHHGKNAAGGHYTAAVHHGTPFGWVHFDDNNIQRVNVNNVLKHQQGCVPYLLFYEQSR